jgi:hypothetical protein
MANIFTPNLNLAIPSAGDLNWENEYSDFAQATDDLGNLFCFTLSIQDPAVVGVVFYDGLIPQENITVKAIGIFARTAPTGLDLKIDVLKNGIAQNNPANLTNGSQFEKTALLSPIWFLVTDRMGFIFSQVGSVVAGDKVVLTVYYQKEAIASPL